MVRYNSQTGKLLQVLKANANHYMSFDDMRKHMPGFTDKQLRHAFYNARGAASMVDKHKMRASNSTYGWFESATKPQDNTPIPSVDKFDAESAFDTGRDSLPFSHVGTTSTGVMVLEDNLTGDIFVARRVVPAE